jgi:hypothetical protein
MTKDIWLTDMLQTDIRPKDIWMTGIWLEDI